MTQSEKNDRTLVKPKDLARCKFCGTVHSKNWVIVDGGNIYCSSECLGADTTGQNKLLGACCVIFGFVSLVIGGVLGFIWGFIMIILGIWVHIKGIQDEQYKDRKDQYRDTLPLVCSYCSHVNPPNLMRCQNCGASIRDSEFVEIEDFDSSEKPVLKARIVCPSCKSVYSYDITSRNEKGIILCQHCNRSFNAPNHLFH